ncbi:hypothetical protein [Xanthobacter wiegelii]|uniref:hypothetical protein n=1 Tax=Xanthobacter wiegelii TaxID=3119913 RepID=UPI00372C41EE
MKRGIIVLSVATPPIPTASALRTDVAVPAGRPVLPAELEGVMAAMGQRARAAASPTPEQMTQALRA